MSCQTPPDAVTRRVLLGACLAGSTLQTLVACHPTPLRTFPQAPSDGVTMHLIAYGWHTEIALPIHAIHGPLTVLASDFPGSRYLVFGWGERNYYMARAPTFADAIRALTPGPAVLLVTPLYGPPRDSRAGAEVFEFGLPTERRKPLSDHIWAAIEKSSDGTPRRLAAGPHPGSVFYAATGTYSATYTCNTWAAESLRAGGVPVTSAGVVSASQLTDQLRS
jgi:uncharacterized protein (TIGR02117 family)